ncbi:MAG: DUF2135 domain-containing protein [bacterium]|nr:DUF2135 domain-containing protein [bacterium]
MGSDKFYFSKFRRLLACALVPASLLLIFAVPDELPGASVIIETPRGGTTRSRMQLIAGRINGFRGERATLILNGIPQGLRLQNGSFRREVIVAPGTNVIEVVAGAAPDRVSFYAEVPARDVKVVLTWDTPTDVDLWVVDPKGEKCYYQNQSTKTGGNLDVDITDGYGPETYTMARALGGEYSVQVQYYSSGGQPITRVKLFVVLHEGTPRESRQEFQFVMTRESQVYQIARFHVDPGR